MASEVPALKDWDMSAGAKKGLFRSLFPFRRAYLAWRSAQSL